ncbi:histidine phosphatase family protein [Legionella sp. PC997]|uniref:histidine phosphatase family protein n=1 Tax=Legionella sp. PC997 TaxID=2755562 RepID=UPI0015FA3D28|nr:histidine phosphatase family protein [Legionella sp. PC997]QMT61780.1 phosphoglycerate mutase family protein [Legionella sp. PC997]
MRTRLLVARHGNTFAPGELVRRVGITDLPLVNSGFTQGNKLGNYLKTNGLIPDVIFTSKLKRAIQTAEQAQKTMGTHLSIETLAIFNEIDYGPDENLPEEEVVARLGKEAIYAWETQAIVPEGWNVDPSLLIQNWVDFSLRIRKEYPGKTCLVVTSNGIARFAPYLTGDFAAFSAQYGIKVATGGLCVFEHKEPSGTWDCLAWNVKPQ